MMIRHTATVLGSISVLALLCSIGMAPAGEPVRAGAERPRIRVDDRLVIPTNETAGPDEAILPARTLFMAGPDVLVELAEGSSGSEMTVKISVPDPIITEQCRNGEIFSKIRLPGYGHTSQIGCPQLPTKGLLLAVPEGAVLWLEVLRTEAVTRSGYTVVPVPRAWVDPDRGETYEEFCPDQAVYSTEGHYPGRLVEEGFCGYLRDVRVAQVRIFPVQYNPARNELVFHRRIWLKIRLAGGSLLQPVTARQARSQSTDPFSAIYSNLILNYDPESAGIGPHPAGMAVDSGNLGHLSSPALKIRVFEDGVYTIESNDFAAAGVYCRDIDPRTIKVLNLGSEVPIYVCGEGDGRFDAADHIEFFGLGDGGAYSPYNTYWITWGGSQGERMKQQDCAPGGSLPVLTAVEHRIHFEEDNIYYVNVYEGQGKDHWFWDELAPCCPRLLTLLLPAVSGAEGDAEITINLRGKAGLPHDLKAYVNGHLIGDLLWDGMLEFETDLNCPQAHLLSGENQLLIGYASQDWDRVFLNWLDFEYLRDLTACGDRIGFTDSEPGLEQFNVVGFSGSEIELFDITDPASAVRLTGYSVTSTGSGYTLGFEAREDGREYVALTAAQRREPGSIIYDPPSYLRSLGNGADYIIITHEDFYESLQPLKSLRESEGLRVKIAKISDIYDEFNYGIPDPQAVKDFLRYAYDFWQSPPPSYVLLAGDASFDYKGNIPDGNLSYVPTHLFISQTDYVETCSDDWFVCIVGDDHLPDMLIGRLAAQAPEEMEVMVSKIIAYEMSVPDGDWRRTALLVADNADQGGDFEAVCDRFERDYFTPAGFGVMRANVSECGDGCTDEVISHVNGGCTVWNYVGHGALDLWASEGVFESSDVMKLSNGEKLPLVVALTCFNGFFHHATDDCCLAEALVRRGDGGAIACWCHSAYNYTSPSEVVCGFLYEALLRDGNHILGSAVSQAKMQYLATSPYFWDQAPMLMLFGDPALEMGFPGRPDIVPGPLTFRPRKPLLGEADTLRASIFNCGRGDAIDVLVRFRQGHPENSEAEIIADTTIPNLHAGDRTVVSAIWESVPDPGSYQISVQVDPENRIMESSEWNNVASESLTVCSPDDLEDRDPPGVELIIDEKIVGAEFHDYDYASCTPVIRAILTDCESGIRTDEITVSLNGDAVHDIEVAYDKPAADTVVVIYSPGRLDDGLYTVSLSVRDASCNSNLTEATVAFAVESNLRIRGLANHPNPFAGGTAFTYCLSQDAEGLEIEIYSVTGRLLATISDAPHRQNVNTLDWTGRADDGYRLPSGVYLCRITARRGSESCTETAKMVVIR